MDPDCLHRVLRAAVNYHCLAVAPGAWGRPARFQNNVLSRLLLADHPTHMKAFVRPRPLAHCNSANECDLAAEALRLPGSTTAAVHVLCGRHCAVQPDACCEHGAWSSRLSHLQVFHMVDNTYGAWGELPWAVGTGGNGFKRHSGGQAFFEFLQVRPRGLRSARVEPGAPAACRQRRGTRARASLRSHLVALRCVELQALCGTGWRASLCAAGRQTRARSATSRAPWSRPTLCLVRPPCISRTFAHLLARTHSVCA